MTTAVGEPSPRRAPTAAADPGVKPCELIRRASGFCPFPRHHLAQPSRWRRLVVRWLVLLLGLNGISTAAQVYRCEDASGAISYADRPCSGAAERQSEVRTVPTITASPAVKPEARPRTQPLPYRRPARVEVPPLPNSNLADLTGALPKDARGRPILATTGPGGADLVLERSKEPRPVNALARCSLLVSHCHAPGRRELDACFFSVPRCRTNEPWREAEACCPEACWQRYEAVRERGQSPLAAFDEALFGRESCFPGLRSGGVDGADGQGASSAPIAPSDAGG